MHIQVEQIFTFFAIVVFMTGIRIDDWSNYREKGNLICKLKLSGFLEHIQFKN